MPPQVLTHEAVSATRSSRGWISDGSGIALSTLLATSLSGCRSTAEGSRWERHASSEIWSQAVQQQWDRPWQRTPEAAALVATPLLAFFDTDLSEDASHHYLTGGHAAAGDDLALGLGGAALLEGALEALHGDDARSLEVGAESLFLTELSTEVLKSVAHRRRPGGSGSTTSFPSGHTSFSFAAATYLARRIDDENDGPYDKLGYLLYVPALYVGINRVEVGRHFPSDVAFGAFLGMFVSNFVYNAHYGDEVSDRPGIFRSRKRLSWNLGPAILENSLVLSLDISF